MPLCSQFAKLCALSIISFRVMTCQMFHTGTLMDKLENHLIHHRADSSSDIVLYFGGDVQDLESHMLQHRDNHRYVKWSLEATGKLLFENFGRSRHIVVVRPNKLHLGTFSVYSSFVESNTTGVPSHSSSAKICLTSLSVLLDHVRALLSLQTADHLNISLIAFSKGCVVLNQLVYELADSNIAQFLKDNLLASQFFNSVSHIIWLDGGHSGGHTTWVTDQKILGAFASNANHIKIECHVTPYQVSDTRRPWIGKEQKLFVSRLVSLGCPIRNTVHFSEEPGSLENHFRVLETFHV